VRRSRLTASERRIAMLVARGETNKQVADALGKSAKTVEWHLTHVYRKLGIHSRRELIAMDPLGSTTANPLGRERPRNAEVGP
jgi:DNA-binding CsgD family transcriptional regulator